MISVALIGADGAGKTTIANQLLERYPGKLEYIYMGGNLQSSNLKLPLSRFIVHLRNILKKKSGTDSGILGSVNKRIKSPDEWWTGDDRGSVFAFFRMLNRIMEDGYRLFVSWRYKRKGKIVIYDRHVLFEKMRDHNIAMNNRPRLTERIHIWIIRNLYPEPDLIIFLDAAAEVLFKRKGETSLEFIEFTRQLYLKAGEEFSNFRIVDVNQPVEKICDAISEIIFPAAKSKDVKFEINMERN